VRAEARSTRLLAFRILYLGVLFLTLGLFLVALPERFRELSIVSVHAERAFQQLAPTEETVLLEIGLSPLLYALYVLGVEGTLLVGFTIIGLAVVWRQQKDWMVLYFAIASLTYGAYAVPPLDALLETHPALVLPSHLIQALGLSTSIIFFYVFPDGRLVPRWTRPLAVGATIWAFSWLFIPGLTFDPFNPFLFPVPVFLMHLGWYGSGVVAQIHRYRHETDLARRQQTKWVAFSLTFALVVYALILIPYFIFPALSEPGSPSLAYKFIAEPLFLVSLFFVLLALALSMLRYRLWEIDQLINRTLVYAGLTATVTVVYFGSVFLLQHLFRALAGENSSLVIAVATVVSALVVRPLRDPIQLGIDRRFYRRKYDVRQTLLAFSRALRDTPQTDLDRLSGRLLALISETMQPDCVVLWSLQTRGGVSVSRVCQRHAAEMHSHAIERDDPLLHYLQQANPTVIDIHRLLLGSPALQGLKEEGMRLLIPLVSQGEMVGLLAVGERLSEQEYSSEDRRLLFEIAAQAAPALRVAQLARQQQVVATERERFEQELRVARLIQQTLLPRDLPVLQGWQVAAYYAPAREVGGDFYDFIMQPDGRLGVVIGDVSDTGVPAALLMASTRSILKIAAGSCLSPGSVLEQVNDLLYPDMPPHMFVTCQYAIIDLESGYIRFANAGHSAPFYKGTKGIGELRATGMPLGLMPGMRYDEQEAWLAPGESLLLYSDGITEARDRHRQMFGTGRLAALLAGYSGGPGLIPYILAHLDHFIGHGGGHDDDMTLVTIERSA
jgi:serine phosphatase RsbU (regulator of sigma subunit)